MGTTTHPAAPDPATGGARTRRLELLLGAIETLEGPEPLVVRVRGVLDALVDARLCVACGVVGAVAVRAGQGLTASGPPGVAEHEAQRAARTGDERRCAIGPLQLVAVPLRSSDRLEGALWCVVERVDSADGEFVGRLADRLVRAIEAERARQDQLAQASELRRSDALKTALLRGVTHEMKTPLAGIAGAADALRVIDDPEERADLLQAVIGETQRLERVVSNLLDLSRVEGGVLAARMEWCVLEELVGAGLQAGAVFLDGVEVTTDIAADAPLVRADPVLVERILTNLLHNAVRHGAPPVQVTGRPTDAGIELAVSDAGPGVHPDVLPSVFEPFVHREGVGLGLGLPLCRRLAEAQGARLEHRAGPRGGACFVIVFPFGDPPAFER